LSVRLRLTRMGRKKRPYYRIIAVDSRKKRDGSFIERLGYYHPLNDPPTISVDGEKTLKWLRVGAQPSYTVRSILRKVGVWYRFKLEKRKLPESQITEMMLEWMKENSPKEPEVKEVAVAEPVAAPEEEVAKPEASVAEAVAAPEEEAAKPKASPSEEPKADSGEEKPKEEKAD